MHNKRGTLEGARQRDGPLQDSGAGALCQSCLAWSYVQHASGECGRTCSCSHCMAEKETVLGIKAARLLEQHSEV